LLFAGADFYNGLILKVSATILEKKNLADAGDVWGGSQNNTDNERQMRGSFIK